MGFIVDEDAHRARILRMIAMADIVKVSDEDLTWIANGQPFEALISTWLEGVTNIVVLTRGGESATAFTKTGSLDIPVMDVTVIDTIGAGDTFNAGFMFGLERSDLLTKSKLNGISPSMIEPALKLATQVAGLTVSKAGANSPWLEELS